MWDDSFQLKSICLTGTFAIYNALPLLKPKFDPAELAFPVCQFFEKTNKKLFVWLVCKKKQVFLAWQWRWKRPWRLMDYSTYIQYLNEANSNHWLGRRMQMEPWRLRAACTAALLFRCKWAQVSRATSSASVNVLLKQQPSSSQPTAIKLFLITR